MQTAPPLLRCPVCGFPLQGEPRPTPETPVHCARPSCGVRFLSCEPERVRLGTFRLVDHYSLCVLPFAFPEQEAGDVRRRLADSGRWRLRTFSLDDPEDVDRTEYFLPYIRRFLFPSLYAAADTAGERAPRAPTCQHHEFDLARLGPAGRRGLPLTLRCHDSGKKLGFEYRLLLDKVELVLFSYRVGFLVLNEQSEELDNYLRNRMRERVEWLVRLGGFLAAAVPAVFGLEAIIGKEEWVAILRWSLLAVLVIGTSIFAWFVVYRRGDDR